MHKFVFYNREILQNSEIRLPAISAAALYGKGVFTTLAVYHKNPFLWEKHWRRIIENAEKIGIDLSDFNEKFVKKALLDLIEKNEILKSRVRLTFFDTSESLIWKTESTTKTNFLIQTADFRAVSENLRLTVSPFQINSKSPLTNIKSCNYLENILALEDAEAKGFDEAIRLNERGEIASACMANIFWIKDKILFTPDIETGCLAGTTREFLTESAKEQGFRIYFVKQNLNDLLNADEIFLTSAGLNITAVEKIDKVSFEHKFVRKLKEKLYNSQITVKSKC
jgi:branched-subunit amino acid aminotransferase/4-amino-4-deoxychorismate lyase